MHIRWQNLAFSIGLILVAVFVGDAQPVFAQSRLHFEFEICDSEDLEVRLDNFIFEAANNPDTSVHVFIYGGENRRRGERQAWTDYIRKHLLNRRARVLKQYGINANHISILEGGFRDALTVELWITPRGESAPVTKATVEPRNVRYKGRALRRHEWRNLYKADRDCYVGNDFIPAKSP